MELGAILLGSVKSFREFALSEKRRSGFPLWLKGVVTLIVARIRSISIRIEKETDPKKKMDLLAVQNRLLGYVSGLSIAIDTKNKSMLKKLKSNAPK